MRTRYAFVALIALALALAGASMLFTVGYYRTEQASQQRQGVTEEQRLCTTLGSLAALKPPAGSPADNPSRAFDQRLYQTLNQLAPDLGCGAAKGTP